MATVQPEPNIHTWLAQVRERPGMYVPRRDLAVLEHQVSGYYTALDLRGMVEDVPSMHVAHFGTWLWLTRRWSTASGWAHAINRHSGEREPLDVFFRLWDKYCTLVPTTIAFVSLAPHHQPRGKRAIVGIDGRIERPDAIEIRRYAPTGLHHFRWHFAEHRRDDSMLMDEQGSHDTSLTFAQQWACDEFGIEVEAWELRS